MPTAAIANGIYETLRTRLSAAEVQTRLHGKTLRALLALPTEEERTSFYGAEDGYDGSLYFKDSELPQKGISSGDVVEIKDGSKWVERRVISVETKCQVIHKAMCGSLHRD